MNNKRKIDQYINIQKANLIDPVSGCLKNSNVFLKNCDGRYTMCYGVEAGDEARKVKKLRLYREYLSPGFVDMQCTVGATPSEYSINWYELVAANHGGYTAICPVPVWDKYFEKKDNIKNYLKDIKRYRGIEIVPCLPVPKRRQADKSWGIAQLAELGCKVISDHGRYLSNEVMREIMYECAASEVLLITSGHDPSLIQDGCVNRGKMSRHFRLPGISGSAELCAVSRNLILAGETGARIHIPGVSLALSCQLIRNAKEMGVKVTASTSPQYFCCNENELIFRGAQAKLYPPLRSMEDMEGVADAIADGTIDCISSDNTPIPAVEKSDLATGRFGCSGFETAFSASYTGLVATGRISLFRLIDAMSITPRRILFGSEGVENAEGYITFDVDSKHFFVKTSVKTAFWNSVFDGRDLHGVVTSNFNQLSLV